jgi:hypothetical protein
MPQTNIIQVPFTTKEPVTGDLLQHKETKVPFLIIQPNPAFFGQESNDFYIINLETGLYEPYDKFNKNDYVCLNPTLQVQLQNQAKI